MNKKVSLWASISIALVVCVVTFLVTATVYNISFMNRLADLSENAAGCDDEMHNKFNTIEEYVNRYFLGEIDEITLEENMFRAYMSALGDKYTMYHSSEEMEDFLSDSRGNYVGIGVHVSYDVDTEGIYVFAVFPSSPAEKAGIKVGDVIVKVENIECTEETYTQAVDAVVGEAGTQVSITVQRNGETIETVATRNKVDSVTAFYRNVDGKAVINITQFSATTPKDFKACLEQAKKDGATEYIFDMRNNGGGNLDAIVEVLNMLLPEGKLILTTTDKDGKVVQSYTDNTKELLDAPIAVLVNSNTASAAELFTAALRDHDMATIVGITTYGKGKVQQLIPLSDGSGIRLTTHMYNPPCGVNYEGIGIVPDIEKDLPEYWQARFYKMTAADDTQLQAAIEALNK